MTHIMMPYKSYHYCCSDAVISLHLKKFCVQKTAQFYFSNAGNKYLAYSLQVQKSQAAST